VGFRRLRRLVPASRALVAYLLLPNAIFGVASSAMGVQRQLVNLDYLVVGILATFLSARLTAMALGMALLADAFVNFAPMYNFEVPDAVNALRDVWGIDDRWTVVSLIAFILLATTFLAMILARIGRQPSSVRTAVYVLLPALSLIAGVDVLNGSNRYVQLSNATIPVNLATSDGGKLLEGIFQVIRDGAVGGSPSPVTSASAQLFDVDESAGQHVVLVLVESLGQLSAEGSDSALFAPLLHGQITQRYIVRIGSVPSRGSTTSGEMRELCGVQASHRTVKSVDHGACLPARYHRAGYATTAIHGYKRTFFGRSHWYPELGFQQAMFDEELRAQGAGPSCGFVYRGTCDAVAAEAVDSVLHGTDKRSKFVYWLSLNAHIPLDDRTASASSFDCSSATGAFANLDICRWAKIQSIVIERLAHIASDTTIAPTRFVIVGDHPPPFAGRKRDLFVPGRVPFVELVPRSRSQGE
jgi:hypothetical protein